MYMLYEGLVGAQSVIVTAVSWGRCEIIARCPRMSHNKGGGIVQEAKGPVLGLDLSSVCNDAILRLVI
eukprot:6180686-Pleurochrysis_carterae.AAC.1